MQGQGRARKRQGGEDEQTDGNAGKMLVHKALRATPRVLGSQRTRGVPDPGVWGGGVAQGTGWGRRRKFCSQPPFPSHLS